MNQYCYLLFTSECIIMQMFLLPTVTGMAGTVLLLCAEIFASRFRCRRLIHITCQSLPGKTNAKRFTTNRHHGRRGWVGQMAQARFGCGMCSGFPLALRDVLFILRVCDRTAVDIIKTPAGRRCPGGRPRTHAAAESSLLCAICRNLRPVIDNEKHESRAHFG